MARNREPGNLFDAIDDETDAKDPDRGQEGLRDSYHDMRGNPEDNTVRNPFRHVSRTLAASGLDDIG